jgi:hypothetical protein
MKSDVATRQIGTTENDSTWKAYDRACEGIAEMREPALTRIVLTV